MAITFGSFGDIITAVQIAAKLLEVLNAQRGAKREFRDLIIDLRVFHRFLDQLLSLWQTREEGPALDKLYDILQPVILDAKGEISAFLERIISKYGKNLTTSSRRNPKDVGKMLQWHVLERDGIARLQDKLRKSKDIIMMVQGQANMIAEEQNRALLAERMSALEDAEAEAVTKLDDRLDQLNENLDEQYAFLSRIYSSLGTISSAIVPLAMDIPTMLSAIYRESLAQRALLGSLNPYAHNSALVEDSLGWRFQIPLELMLSWNTVHSILLDKFANRAGFHLVKQRRYVLRDCATGMELSRNLPPNYTLSPNQKINMSMVYFFGDKNLMVCPKCKKSTLCAQDNDITCLNSKCGMEIQRIEEIVDEEDIKSSFGNPSSNQNEDRINDVTEADYEESLPIELASKFSGLPKEDGPEIFKRIRYITRWDFRGDSRGRLYHSYGQISWWEAVCHEVSTMRSTLSQALTSKLGLVQRRWDTTAYLGFYFVGPSRQQSRPAIVIFSMSKSLRKEVWRHCKDIDWVKAPSPLLVFSTSFSGFREDVKRCWLRSQSRQGRNKRR